jgi:hypothetical protein
MTPEEYEAKRAARLASKEDQRAAQLAADLDALCALEDEHGEGRIYRHDLPTYVPGLPTMAVVRTPTAAEYKRFRDMMRKAKNDTEKGAAVDLLSAPCRVYPDAPTFDKLLAAFPGLGDALAQPILKLAEGSKQEQGKG